MRGGDMGPLSRDRLFLTLAQQLRSPLVGIARRAELSKMQGKSSLTAMSDIELTASGALQLIDNFILSQQLEFDLEPLVVSSVIYDAADNLDAVAKNYGCQIITDFKGRNAPVMASRKGLLAALTSLGHVFVEAVQNNKKNHKLIKIGAHPARGGLAIGVFSDDKFLSAEMLRRGRLLAGRSNMPLGKFTMGSAAGVFIADALLAGMSTKLRVSYHENQVGLGATFVTSRQLTLI